MDYFKQSEQMTSMSVQSMGWVGFLLLKSYSFTLSFLDKSLKSAQIHIGFVGIKTIQEFNF